MDHIQFERLLETFKPEIRSTNILLAFILLVLLLLLGLIAGFIYATLIL